MSLLYIIEPYVMSLCDCPTCDSVCQLVTHVVALYVTVPYPTTLCHSHTLYCSMCHSSACYGSVIVPHLTTTPVTVSHVTATHITVMSLFMSRPHMLLLFHSSTCQNSTVVVLHVTATLFVARHHKTTSKFTSPYSATYITTYNSTYSTKYDAIYSTTFWWEGGGGVAQTFSFDAGDGDHFRTCINFFYK